MKKLICLIAILISSLASNSPIPQTPARGIVVAGGGGGTPTFGSEIARGIETGSGGTTATAAMSGAVASNERIVIIVTWNSATQTVTGITDSKGNTYAKTKELLAAGGGADNYSEWTANAGTALTTSDTLTITWGTPGNTYRAWVVCRLTGCNTSNASTVDQTASADAFNTAVTAAASTTAANTVALGVVFINNDFATKQYGSSAWTLSGGARQDWGGATKQNYFVYKNISASGSQDPGGTITPSAENYSVIWTAFK